tara:strand:- start:1056 stop:1157 length:102 start_codon:yes stop_codon:yes gene_type:complete
MNEEIVSDICITVIMIFAMGLSAYMLKYWGKKQ